MAILFSAEMGIMMEDNKMALATVALGNCTHDNNECVVLLIHIYITAEFPHKSTPLRSAIH